MIHVFKLRWKQCFCCWWMLWGEVWSHTKMIDSVALNRQSLSASNLSFISCGKHYVQMYYITFLNIRDLVKGFCTVRAILSNSKESKLSFFALTQLSSPRSTKRAKQTAPSKSHIPQLTLLIPLQWKSSSLWNDTGSCLAARQRSLF